MDMLFSRKFIQNQQVQKDDMTKPISVASYNILADCHALRGLKENSQYQWTTEDQLKIAHRHDRILQELEYLDSDIYCLQEVGPAYFQDVLLPAMTNLGCDGVFMKRQEGVDEGEALLFRKERFELVESEGFWLNELTQKQLELIQLSTEQKKGILDRVNSAAVVLLAKLKCKLSGRELTVGSIHVDFGNLKKDDMQCTQISSAIKKLVDYTGGPDKPHIIAGDFNSVPTGPGYQLASTGAVSGDCLQHLEGLKEIDTGNEEKLSLISLWKDGFQHPSHSLKSSYHTVKKEEPLSSVFPHDGGIRAVDYIWFSSASLELHGVLETVPPSAVQNGIPNTVAPSDHLSVKAVYSFK